MLFCDVTGSTTLGEWLDPESVRQVMRRYFDVARRVIAHYGGMAEKFTGDAVMAVFGVPVLQVADPGAIVIDPQTWRLVRGTVTAEPLQLRGKSHPVITYG